MKSLWRRQVVVVEGSLSVEMYCAWLNSFLRVGERGRTAAATVARQTTAIILKYSLVLEQRQRQTQSNATLKTEGIYNLSQILCNKIIKNN